MWLATLTIAIREIRRNVMRSSLTTLGVVIGVGAVIALMTLGAGASHKVTSEIASLGENLLIVTPGRRMHGPGGTSALAQPFTLADVAAIRREVANTTAVAPAISEALLAVSGSANRLTNVVGTEPDYFAARNLTFDRGRPFSDNEVHAGKSVCVIGATVANDLYGANDPIDQTMRLKGMTCTVIGLLHPKGQSMGGSDQDDIIVMPLKTLQTRIAGDNDVNVIFVSARDSASTDKVRRDLDALLRQRRHLAADGSTDDFHVTDLKDIASTVQRTTGILTTLLGAVASISLLVGGIGIMNIMLVSVTERTREIGIRLAVGARGGDVLLQFLVESVVLSAFGGLLGVVIGLTGSAIAAHSLDLPFTPDLRVIALAFLFSGAVGVAFGYLPARKAAALNPIDALRHE
jgi:putative ABC transport system permease protein